MSPAHTMSIDILLNLTPKFHATKSSSTSEMSVSITVCHQLQSWSGILEAGES